MDGTVLGVEVLVWFGLEFIFVCLGFGVFGFFFPVGFFWSGGDATYETAISINPILSVSDFCWRPRGMEACVYFRVSEATDQSSTY